MCPLCSCSTVPSPFGSPTARTADSNQTNVRGKKYTLKRTLMNERKKKRSRLPAMETNMFYGGRERARQKLSSDTGSSGKRRLAALCAFSANYTHKSIKRATFCVRFSSVFGIFMYMEKLLHPVSPPHTPRCRAHPVLDGFFTGSSFFPLLLNLSLFLFSSISMFRVFPRSRLRRPPALFGSIPAFHVLIFLQSC